MSKKRTSVKLAKLIARDIMRLGDEKDNPCQRIQFMGGTWPDKETRNGGLCEDALADEIEISLNRHTS